MIAADYVHVLPANLVRMLSVVWIDCRSCYMPQQVVHAGVPASMK